MTVLTSLIKRNEIFVGPGTAIGIDSYNYTRLYEEAKLEKFVAVAETAWRASLECLDVDLSQLATNFTISDLPGKGYGISDVSIAKAASSILQCVATAVLLKRPLLNEDLIQIIDQCTLKTQQNPAIVALRLHLNTRDTNERLDVASFILPISTLAMNSLSTANQKINANVEKKLKELFGDIF